MKRLPRYDHGTGRLESAAYVGLGLVGATTILLTIENACRFSTSRDEIIAASSAPVSQGAGVGSNNTHRPFTNVTHIENSRDPRIPNRNSPAPRS